MSLPQGGRGALLDDADSVRFEVVDEVLQHVHHVWGNVVECNGVVTAAVRPLEVGKGVKIILTKHVTANQNCIAHVKMAILDLRTFESNPSDKTDI